MAKTGDKEIKALEAKAAAAQAEYDAARSAVDSGESYAKNLEAEYREALANPKDFDRLTDLQARRNAVGAVIADLQSVLEVADREQSDADEAVRHETKLQQGLKELSPKAQALIQAWKNDGLPSRVRLATGDYLLHNLVGQYVDKLRRGDVQRVRREIEDVAERVELSE